MSYASSCSAATSKCEPDRSSTNRVACSTGLRTSRVGSSPPSGSYVLNVTDPDAAAPEVARALVAANADILSIAESHHSLEDVYLELVDEDVEAKRR